MVRMYYLIFSVGLLAWLSVGEAFGQTSQVQFGKNRVQYHSKFDEWQQYESENFVTYWYGEGRNIGQAAVLMAEKEYPAIQTLLDYRINDKMELIIYNDLTDLKQSNIGAEDAFTNANGQTKIVGNKIFVYFDGDHRHLQAQIREGIGAVLLEAMLFGSTLQEMVQNAVQLNLPEWYRQGLLAFVGTDWSAETDNQLRDVMLSGKYKNLSRLAEVEPRLAGHAMWYFVLRNHGSTGVANLLYITRINRNVESGFQYVLGLSVQQAMESCWANYLQRYEGEVEPMQPLAAQQSLKVKARKKMTITQVSLSPDGKKLAYATNEKGRIRVFVQDVQTGKRRVMLRTGYRNLFQATDYNYPLLAWHPDNVQLTIMYERRDVIKIRYADTQTGKHTDDVLPTEIQRVFSIRHLNPQTLVMSAASRGISDLWLFSTNTRNISRLTNDFWDDLDPVPFNLDGRQGILFASNRPSARFQTEKLDSIVPTGFFDIFALVSTDTGRMMVRTTFTPFNHERQPLVLDDKWFGFLSDESGIVGRSAARLDTVVDIYERKIWFDNGTFLLMNADSSLAKLDTAAIDSMRVYPVYKTIATDHRVQTNFDRNIEAVSSAPRVGKIAESARLNGVWQIYLRSTDTSVAVEPSLTRYCESRQRQLQIGSRNTSKVAETIKDSTANRQPVINPNYLFQSDFDETPVVVAAPAPKKNTIEVEFIDFERVNVPNRATTAGGGNHTFKQQRIIPARLKFRTDFVTTTIDNSPLFGGLDSYVGLPQDGFRTPPMGLLVKANLKDLFEDYVVEGGGRFSTTLNGKEYFLTFQNRRGRIDKQYAIYRKTQRFTLREEFPLIRQRSNIFLGMATFSYPLDVYQSLRATTTLRFDNGVIQSTDSTTLFMPASNEQRAGLRLEYVFDNSRQIAPNILNGARAKISFEAVKRFNFSATDSTRFSLNNGYMGIATLDARHYLRITRRAIWANRFAAGTSFGSERILYYLGGSDNWAFAKFNRDMPTSDADNFAYQTTVNNLRGFRQNSRNGSTYFLLNSEVRLPVIQMMFRRPLRSGFLRNLQLVGFVDLGTAWYGATPFSDENPLNTVWLPSENNGNTPVTLKVTYFRDPLIASYGLGLRTMLFGYFVRADYGWGIETRVVQKPMLHFSLGYDF